MKKVGAVIVFEDGVTQEEALSLFTKLRTERKIEVATIREFNPDHGYPVFYIP
jgi:hypothetical protein